MTFTRKCHHSAYIYTPPLITRASPRRARARDDIYAPYFAAALIRYLQRLVNTYFTIFSGSIVSLLARYFRPYICASDAAIEAQSACATSQASSSYAPLPPRMHAASSAQGARKEFLRPLMPAQARLRRDNDMSRKRRRV